MKQQMRHIPPSQYPAQALCVALYETAGVRAVEIGSVMFGKPRGGAGGGGGEEPAALELVRLTFPRRVYTQSHVDYLAEALIYVAQHAKDMRGLKITYQAPQLRHFTARFEPV